MKNKILIILFLLCSSSTFACDICGCFMGITPYDNVSSFGIFYRYRSYNGYFGQDQQFFPSGSSFFPIQDQTNNSPGNHNGLLGDYEVYRTTELRGRYFLQKRLEINAIIPYLNNTEKYNNQTSTISGLGDMTFYAGYHLIRKLDQKKMNQRLILGAGIKLPTANNRIKSDQGFTYSNPFQPGTGSTDGFVYANYIIGIKNWGASINSTYKFNGQNADQESIANSTTSFLSIFRKIDLGKNVKIIPSVQTSYEFTKGEKYQGKLTGEHETNNLMAGAGLDIFVKNIGINTSFQTNAWSAQTDHPRSSGRLTLGITYNLKQLYYAIN
ncbi:hypothetical protein I5M32_13615 [Pedobacter sp. SD-b]|uniref:MetA-pathway of phenol degradation n=1 Tax=Pedobacter segetis TaxID=2793069 RepID=A0ABS1BMB9_9SPHI|nr:hypothetical protein [Pedobacter segetis]MBK0384001.1 hypothetical protein [Pedobacter segetis]